MGHANLLVLFGQPGVRTFVEKLHGMMRLVAEAARLEAAMVGSIGLEFSAARNSKHGLPAFNAMISAMSIHDAYVSEGSEVLIHEAIKHVPFDTIRDLRFPTPQWALGMFDGVDHDRPEDACGRALDAQIRALRDRGAIPRANLASAYDMHSSSSYGKTEDPSCAVSGPHSADTNSHARFTTGAAASGPYAINTGLCRVKTVRCW